MTYTIGAYAASPSGLGFNQKLETDYYQSLSKLDGLGGLEIPFYGDKLHRDNTSWFLEQLKSEWNHVITCIPGTMDKMQGEPQFGLASAHSAGRAQALVFLEKARQAVLTLNRYVRRQAVKQVFIHSAPQLGKSGVSSSKEALAESLATALAWDWDGADIVIEHCDAFVDGQAAAKGFLNLEDEIWALQKMGSARVGVVINWGRSALETRGVDGPLIHIQTAKRSGLLRGLMFSGVTVNNSLYGAWQDSHVPFAKDFGINHGVADSLMTADQVRACLAAADDASLNVLGFKIQVLPTSATVAERVGFLSDGIRFMQRAARAL